MGDDARDAFIRRHPPLQRRFRNAANSLIENSSWRPAPVVGCRIGTPGVDHGTGERARWSRQDLSGGGDTRSRLSGQRGRLPLRLLVVRRRVQQRLQPRVDSVAADSIQLWRPSSATIRLQLGDRTADRDLLASWLLGQLLPQSQLVWPTRAVVWRAVFELVERPPRLP